MRLAIILNMNETALKTIHITSVLSNVTFHWTISRTLYIMAGLHVWTPRMDSTYGLHVVHAARRI